MSEQEFNAAMGEWLRRQRKRLGLSQEEIGFRIGVHRNTIHRWEGGGPMSTFEYSKLKSEFERREDRP